MTERRTVPIKHFADVKGGKRLPKGMSLTHTPTSHPYIRVTDFVDGRVDRSGLLYVPEDVYPYIRRYIISKDDIYISIVGTVGLVGKIGDELDGANLTENAAKICNICQEVDRDYVLAFLRSELGQHEISRQTVGSTQPKLALFRIGDICVPLPPLSEQRAIARILGALNDKIELNRRMNETLEAIARALFKSWFVDFDPVRAKMNGEKPFGMDDETAELFSSSFTTARSTSIPCGWRYCQWGDLVTLEYGKGLRNYTGYANGRFPVYGTNGQIGTCDTPLVDRPGIIVGRKGAYRGIHFSDFPFFVIDTAFYVKPTVDIDVRWAYYEMSQHDLNNMDSGSAIPSTSRQDFYQLPALFPPLEIQKRWSQFLQPFWQKQAENIQENQTLIELRDTLLPKLMSGEVRVKDAEKEIDLD